MTTNQLIRALREADPTGDATVLGYDPEIDKDCAITITDVIGVNPTKGVLLLNTEVVLIKEALPA